MISKVFSILQKQQILIPIFKKIGLIGLYFCTNFLKDRINFNFFLGSGLPRCRNLFYTRPIPNLISGAFPDFQFQFQKKICIFVFRSLRTPRVVFYHIPLYHIPRHRMPRKELDWITGLRRHASGLKEYLARKQKLFSMTNYGSGVRLRRQKWNYLYFFAGPPKFALRCASAELTFLNFKCSNWTTRSSTFNSDTEYTSQNVW